MNLWIGDYLKLRNEIHYLEFKLTDEGLSSKERDETHFELEERLQREGVFKIIVNSFEDLESKILMKKYIEGLTLDKIAEQLKYSDSHIKKKHAEIMKVIIKYEVIHLQLEQFKKNFPRKRSKK